jgi:cell division protein DivIC
MFIFVAFVAAYVGTSYMTYAKLDTQKNEVQAQIDQEAADTVLLKSELEMYQTDAYIEKVAREKLGYLKSNEVVYINRSK